MSSIITLGDQTLRLDFSPDTGALIGLTVGDWKVLDRAQLGRAWRLLVPVGRRRNNPAESHSQKPDLCERSADGRRLKLAWNQVGTLHAGVLPIRVEQEISVEGGEARWQTTIENRSSHTVEAVSSPWLGDLRHPPGAEWFKAATRGYSSLDEHYLWPRFQNINGYWGVDTPTQTSARQHASPTSSFLLLRSAERGLYLGVDDQAGEHVTWQIELHPGYASNLHGLVPEGDRIGQHDIFTCLDTWHMPYVQPGETRRLSPVVLRPFTGGWEAGCDIYKVRLQARPASAVQPEWLRQPHSWLQIHVNSPEGEARIPYRLLPEIAVECARHGITAIQVTGWNLGGQDQGNPCHDTDPLLGTWEDLREAIAKSEAMGVRIILFSKFTWADRATERFRTELIHQAVQDPHGDFYHYSGYQYQTPMQLQDINTKRLIPMCFLSERYLQVCEEEFAKIVALKPSGHLFDESQHHGPAQLCFARHHGHRPGAPISPGDTELIRRLDRLAPQGFLHAGEAIYDQEFAVYHLCYFRSESPGHVPLFRYLRPEAQLMTAVCGFDDRHMINQCLMHRYIVSYEPFNFKGRPEDFPLTLAYGKRMDALRTTLRHWLWDAEYRSTVPGTVTVDGKPHPHWGAFKAADGRHAAVIVNYDDLKPITATLVWKDGQTPGSYRLVDDDTVRPASGGIIVPPRCAAVVIPNLT